MNRSQQDRQSAPLRGAALSLAFFLTLAIVHTWPLATSPGTLTRHDNADTYLNQWILAWVAHVLPRDPLSLFEANIFHPSTHALAFSEHLIVQGVMGAPLAWLGASPVLTFNLVLLAGLALTGWTTALAVRQWTGDWAAGLLAGSVAAFNTHTMSRMSHVQAMHVEFLPLALVALDRLIRDPRLGHAVRLAAWSTLQMLCSGYLLVFTALALTVGVAARPLETLRAGRWRLTPALLALAAAITIASCLPFLLPYAAASGEQPLVRSVDEVALYSASLGDYAATVANWHYRWWSHRYYRGTDALFPGVLPLALAAVALLAGLAWRDARARMVLAAGVAAFVLSFGPATWLYQSLYRALPPLAALRGSARFGYLVIFSVAILAGFGLAWVQRRMSARTAPHWSLAVVSATAVLVVNLEALTAPFEYTTYQGSPSAYDALRRDDVEVVAEIPMWSDVHVGRNAVYVFNSTRHWKPLVNGYSGLTPPSYERYAVTLQTFPDEASLALLRGLGVTHIVVHLDHVPEMADRLAENKALEQQVAGRDLRIYRLR